MVAGARGWELADSRSVHLPQLRLISPEELLLELLSLLVVFQVLLHLFLPTRQISPRRRILLPFPIDLLLVTEQLHFEFGLLVGSVRGRAAGQVGEALVLTLIFFKDLLF